jgi:hypothetical protein
MPVSLKVSVRQVTIIAAYGRKYRRRFALEIKDERSGQSHPKNLS